MDSGIGEYQVVEIHYQEQRKLNSEAHEVAYHVAQWGHQSWEVHFAKDTGIGDEGIGRLGQTVREVLPEADTCQVEQGLW